MKEECERSQTQQSSLINTLRLIRGSWVRVQPSRFNASPKLILIISATRILRPMTFRMIDAYSRLIDILLFMWFSRWTDII